MSSNQQITLYTNFDASLINFDPITRNKRGGKMCYMSYGPAKKRIFVQTPPLACPFGVGQYVDEKSGEISYSIDVAFRDLETDAKTKTFYDKMLGLNDVILTHAVKNSGEWLGKTMSRDVVAEFYRSLIKDPKDPKYSPTMKIKIPLVNSQPSVDIFSEDKEKVALDYVTKGSTIRCILELKAIWFVNKNFGCTWQLVQAGVVSRPQKFVGWAFKDDDEDDASPVESHDF
jgi:hypothetical protein